MRRTSDPIERLATLGKALSAEVRSAALCQLLRGEQTLSDLAEALDIPLALASHHVTLLKASGLVLAEAEGRERWVRIAPGVLTLLAGLVSALEERETPENNTLKDEGEGEGE